MIAALALAGIGMGAWSLYRGFSTGVMEAAGQPHGRGRRSSNPLMFWLCAAFNMMMVAVGLLLIVSSLGL